MLTDETDQPDEGEKNQSRRHEQIPREARPRVFLLRGIGFDLLQRQRRVGAGGDGARGDQLVFGDALVFGIEREDAHHVADVDRGAEFARPADRGNLTEVFAEEIDVVLPADDGHVLVFVHGADAQRQFAVLGVAGVKAGDVDHARVLGVERFRRDGFDLREAVFKQALGVLIAAGIAVVEHHGNQVDAALGRRADEAITGGERVARFDAGGVAIIGGFVFGVEDRRTADDGAPGMTRRAALRLRGGHVVGGLGDDRGEALVLHAGLRDDRQIARGGVVVFVVYAGRVGEVGARRAAEHLRRLIHQIGKVLDAAGEKLRNGVGGLVARTDQHD